MTLGSLLPFWVATILYAITLALYAQWFRRADATVGRRATSALGVAALVHLVGIVALGLGRGVWPPVSQGESISLVALSTALLYLFLEWRTGERGMGFLALTLILAAALVGSVKGVAGSIPEVVQKYGQGLHAPLFILAFTSFTMSAFVSLAYLLQYRQLRSRQPGLMLQRLPSLESLDYMTRRSTRVGFLFLTAGLIAGALHAHEAWGRAWEWDPKQCMTLTTWILYGLAMALRRLRAWQGGRIATVNLLAFASVLLGLVLLYAIFPSEHRFG